MNEIFMWRSDVVGYEIIIITWNASITILWNNNEIDLIFQMFFVFLKKTVIYRQKKTYTSEIWDLQSFLYDLCYVLLLCDR